MIDRETFIEIVHQNIGEDFAVSCIIEGMDVDEKTSTWIVMSSVLKPAISYFRVLINIGCEESAIYSAHELYDNVLTKM